MPFIANNSQSSSSNIIWRKDHQNPTNRSIQDSKFSSPDQWENRFNKIKTAFENVDVIKDDDVKFGHRTTARVKSPKFLSKSADSSSTDLKFNDKINRENSFVNKLLLNRKNSLENSVKLPWANATSDGVIVGSLTVCPEKSKMNYFPPISPQPVNQFRHAPMSAFKPVQKKSETRGVENQQKFIFNEPSNQHKVKFDPFARENSNDNNYPILPWIKNNEVAQCENSVNSTLAKFESLYSSAHRVHTPQILGPGIAPLLFKSPSQPSLIQSKAKSFTPSYPNVKYTEPKVNQMNFSSDESILRYDAPSVKQKAQNFQNSFLSIGPVKCPKISEPKKESFKPITTYSVDVAATSTVYPNSDDSSVENGYSPLPARPESPSTPEEQIAVSKIMGSANQQQAVTIRQKTQWRDDDSKFSAVKNLTNSLQKLTTSPSEQKDLLSPKKPPSTLSSSSNTSPQRSPLLPPKLPTGKSSPSSLTPSSISVASVNDNNHNLMYQNNKSPGEPFKPTFPDKIITSKPLSKRPLSADSLITNSDEILDKEDDGVIISRIQIPHCFTVGTSPSSVSPMNVSPSNGRMHSPDTSHFSSYLQKSESCHQMNSPIKGRRPQSLIIPNQPDFNNGQPALPRVSLNPLLKTKSSHSLGIGGKQFEAFINQNLVESKQKTVQEYFSMKNSTSKSNKMKKKVSNGSSSSTLDLDYNLDNVDEAFDALFSSVTTDKNDSKSVRSKEGKQIMKSMSAASLVSQGRNGGNK